MKEETIDIETTTKIKLLIRCTCGHTLPVVSHKTWYGAEVVMVSPCSGCCDSWKPKTSGLKPNSGLT